MNRDVEETLGTDADLRALVGVLCAAPLARTSDTFTASVMAAVRAERASVAHASRWGGLRLVPVLSIAACLALLIALGALLLHPSPVGTTTANLVACQRADGTFSSSSAAPYVQAFAVTALARDSAAAPTALAAAVGALVRDQNAEGGWSSAALSARNVVALREAANVGAAGARGAYKRGLRYLRTHGIGEISSADLVHEAKVASARLDASADRGLSCSVTLCASRL